VIFPLTRATGSSGSAGTGACSTFGRANSSSLALGEGEADGLAIGVAIGGAIGVGVVVGVAEGAGPGAGAPGGVGDGVVVSASWRSAAWTAAVEANKAATITLLAAAQRTLKRYLDRRLRDQLSGKSYSAPGRSSIAEDEPGRAASGADWKPLYSQAVGWGAAPRFGWHNGCDHQGKERNTIP
jgi:hypothetical protein